VWRRIVNLVVCGLCEFAWIVEVLFMLVEDNALG
jgi:hypothetical protein